MANIQKTLDSLQPYVIGIRYLEGTPLVDAVFKEGWTVPEEPNIKRIKGNEEMNYFMIFSETNGVGLDELLGYVERTIKLNQEREKKHELLKAKVNELKEIFKKNSLTKLTRLKFSFAEEELVPNLNDFDIDDDDLISENNNEPIEETIEEINEAVQIDQPTNLPYLDADGNPIELTEEEKEMLEEEARAERNLQLMGKKKNNPIVNAARNVELPPKKKMEMALTERDYETDCDCGPGEACSKCIDKKDL
jgi:hypothetical protein